MYKNIFSCKNKTAIIIGGNGLIGKEIAKALSEFKAEVYIADIRKESAGLPKKIKQVHLDVSSEGSVKEAFNKIIQQSGRLDILVNSVYPKTKDWGLDFEKVPLSSWNNNINSHLGGYFLCCRRAAEIMKKQRGGSIINIASIYGAVAPDFNIYKGTKMTTPAAYPAIKSGIIALTKYIATYYAKYNVRANTVSPGGIFDNQNPAFVNNYSRRTPLGRMANPQDIAGAVIYLAADASSYVTGCNLMVDGGWTVW